MKQTKKQKNQKIPKTQKTKLSTDSSEVQLTLLEHLRELRARVFWVVLAIMAGSAVGFSIRDQLLYLIMKPLKGVQLIYLTPGGGFNFVVTVAIYFGVLVAIPVIVYHLYRFLQPVLKIASRRLISGTLVASGALAIIGASFGYFITIPSALEFLADFAGKGINPSLTADSYLSFVIAYVVGLAALFQLPLLLIMIDRVKPIKPGTLSSSQRYVITGVSIVAAIITPTPDAFNMAMVAVPILAVYQVGVLAVYTRRRLAMRGKQAVDTTQKQVVAEQPLELVVANEIPESNVPEPRKSIFVQTDDVVSFITPRVSGVRLSFAEAPDVSVDETANVDKILGAVQSLNVRDEDVASSISVRCLTSAIAQESKIVSSETPSKRVIRRRNKRKAEEIVDEPWLRVVSDFSRRNRPQAGTL